MLQNGIKQLLMKKQNVLQVSKHYLRLNHLCSHCTLKALTSIRVSNKQKKVDIDIPKVPDFIHKVCNCRKKFIQKYLPFERDIEPLQYQKNMRELEVIVKESILNTVEKAFRFLTFYELTLTKLLKKKKFYKKQ